MLPVDLALAFEHEQDAEPACGLGNAVHVEELARGVTEPSPLRAREAGR
jgi:hypothetical protein